MEQLIRDVMVGMGYVGLGLLVALENLFPPIPSELILPLAGFYVGRGELSFLPALLSSTAGSLGGALVLYAIARAGGRRAILRFHAILRVDEHDLSRLDAGFRRHGLVYVAGARLLPGLRSAVSVPAGIARMPLVAFVALTTLGSAAWNAALIGAGVYLGSNFERVSDLIGPASAVILGIVAVVAVTWWVRRRRRRSADRPGAPG